VPTQLPITLQWKNGNGMIHRTRGVTRDLSKRGVYCHVEDTMPPDQEFDFVVVFPVEMTAATAIALHCRAKAVRLDTKDRRVGVAAVIEARMPVSLSAQDLESERRVRNRVRPASAMPVEFPEVRSQIRDLSPTGAFIADERPFPLGRKLNMRFRLDGHGPVIEVQAIVRRVDPQIGMAVEFTELSEEAAALLVQYAATNNQSN
jgi:PilZ domain-containing protein